MWSRVIGIFHDCGSQVLSRLLTRHCGRTRELSSSSIRSVVQCRVLYVAFNLLMFLQKLFLTKIFVALSVSQPNSVIILSRAAYYETASPGAAARRAVLSLKGIIKDFC